MMCERKGIPTATYVTTSFAAYSRGLCKMQGLEATPLIILQHPVASRPESELKEKVRNAYLNIREALVKGMTE
jgi:hypothetical protein